MRALSTTELLSVWERGAGQPPVQQALTLLSAACPETSPAALANLPIGQRDALLLTLREITFGTNFIGLANCPACDEKVELAFKTGDIRPESETEFPAEFDFQMAGHALRFRLPSSADLLAVNNREQLLARCLADGRGDLPEPIIAAVIEKMSRADPLADIQLGLSCPSCGHKWDAPFDIVAFFWSELNAVARGLLREVHTLASVYGWTESEILALTTARRRCYLEMVNA
jgi:uncharacterized protein (UPF0212 family)